MPNCLRSRGTRCLCSNGSIHAPLSLCQPDTIRGRGLLPLFPKVLLPLVLNLPCHPGCRRINTSPVRLGKRFLSQRLPSSSLKSKSLSGKALSTPVTSIKNTAASSCIVVTSIPLLSISCLSRYRLLSFISRAHLP